MALINSSIRLKLFLLVAVIILPVNSIFPQSAYIDSLRHVISNQPDNLTKTENLISIAKEFTKINFDSVALYTNKAEPLVKKFNYPAGRADINILKGKLMDNANRMQEALDYYEEAFRIADSLDETRRMAVSSYNAGLMLKELSEFDRAIDKFRVSYNLFLSLRDSYGLMGCNNALGMVFSNISEYDSAAIYLHKAIEICDSLGQVFNLAVITSNLAGVYLELGQLDNARKYILKSLEIKKTKNNLNSLALDYNLLGRIEQEAGDYKEALANYQESEKLFLKVNDSLQWCDVQNNIGVMHQDQENYSLALEYYKKALDGYRKMNFIRGVIVVLGNQSALLSDQGKYMEAIALEDTVLRLATDYGLKEYRKDAFQNISNDFFKMGNFEKAFEYQSLLYALKDSIYTLEKETMINGLLLKYEREKDQARILTLENENLEKDLNLKKKTIQRNAFLYTILTVFTLSVFLFVYINQRRRQDRLIAEQKIRQLEEEKKLMAAKLLVEGQEVERKRIATELHDGLGVLLSATRMQFSTIMDKTPENRDLLEKASKMLEQASGDVRKISHNMMPGLLTKMGFFEATEDLFDRINDSGDLKTSYVINGEKMRMNENREIMLYRIIQEMANNTLKHAHAKHIDLSIEIHPDLLDISYTDDGKGFDYSAKLESESLGLKSIQSRVSFLNGTLSVDTMPGQGTKYYLKIPV